MSGPCRERKGVSHDLEGELEATVSYHLGTENRLGFSARAINALDH